MYVGDAGYKSVLSPESKNQMSSKLKTRFHELCAKYSDDTNLIRSYWNEIEESYASKNRFYHNLTHLENMIEELGVVKNDISDFDAILFSVFYHDIVYKATANDNEEKSAEKAKTDLQKLNLASNQIAKIYSQIITTKTHQKSEDPDADFLLDADLAILGHNWNHYQQYTQQIRKEYSVYPDFLYNPGRKKVLKHFLKFDGIYKTAHFRAKYETSARENIKREMELL
jgi:predicted metal-dependent HD superfamily phosphohydrolase